MVRKVLQDQAQTITAIFGGSFNPLHEGHLGIIRALSEDGEIGRVLVVPNRHSPFKPAEEALPDGLRREMLRRATAGLAKVRLCEVELRRPPPSYTHDTVARLAERLPGARLALALGWDAFAEFSRWHRAPEILSQAGLIVFDRAGSEEGPPPMEEWADYLPAPWGERVRVAGPHRLVTAEGRELVRRLPLRLPDCSARAIRRARSLEGVPPAARPVLAAHWAALRREAGEGE